jgi:hypothetical protein
MSGQSLLCDDAGAARRRYNRRIMWLVAVYVLLVMSMAWVLRTTQPPTALRYLMAVASAAPAVGMIVALGAYLAEEADEFRRQLLVQAMLWAVGGTLTATTVWGFVEAFADAPRLMLALVFPIFCVIMGVAHHVLRQRYR